jgi:DNA-directed RNA polymerase
MATIQEQIEKEKHMIARGAAKYRHSEQSARDGGRTHETTYATQLTKSFMPDLVEGIQTATDTSGRAVKLGRYRKLLRRIDADKAALLVLRALFQDIFTERTIPALTKTVGMMIEDEIKFTTFQEDHEEYYNAIIKDFKRKNTNQYRHRHRVLTHKMNEKEVEWEAWTPTDRMQVGMLCLDTVLEHTPLVEKKLLRKGRKTQYVIVLTAFATDWIEKHKDHMSLLAPEFMPSLIEPDAWTALDVGGYYTPGVRRRVPMVKTREKEHAEMLRSADLSVPMAALNRVQNTSWRVNKRVHDVLKTVWKNGLRIGMGSPHPIEIPPSPVEDIKKEAMTPEQVEAFTAWKRAAARLHTMERERVTSNFQAVRIIRMAEDYSQYDKFWYVHQYDFRSRMYAITSAFSPQGPDMGKGVIEFSEGKPLGERGFYHLKVHYANLCGYDKVSFDDRAKYTDELREAIVACAADPLGKAKGLWTDADKPYCALAVLLELADAYKHGPANVLNRIAVARDGSCNGLQHYAAILRDPVGATATNVCRSTDRVVADIYTDVGKAAGVRIAAAGGDTAWRAYDEGLPRKLAKKPVMTLPYGSTKRSCVDSVLDWLADLDAPEFPATTRMTDAQYCTDHLWDAISDVVVSARVGMDWVQGTAAYMAKAGHPLCWTTPTGFVVRQARHKIKTKRVRTQLGGDLAIQIGEFTDELDSRKQSAGSAPNYIHSMDASHMQMTIMRMPEDTQFAMVHDSYGTYACDTDALDTAIREAFVDLYHGWDALKAFRDEQVARTGVDLPDSPALGDFDVRRVRDSPYFFA